MFGGSRVYTEDKFAAVEAATSKMLANPDPEAGLYVVYYYSNGTKLAIPAFYHENPNAANATVFADFNAIQAISDTTKPRVLADWGRETMNDSPPGLREMYYTISTAASPEIIQVARDIYFREVVAVSGIPGLIPNLVIQGITSLQLKQMQKYGGNALGLNPIRGGDGKPCYIMLMAAMWSHASDDEVVHAFMSDVMTKITAEARARGLGSRYQYMNYASQYQDVVKGYGCTNKARLSAIARKYDPQGVFQVLQPGGFKLDRAPLPDSRYFST